MKISIVVPIFNESRHLRDFLERLDSLKLPIEKELIFVDDASTDASAKILHDFSFRSEHRILDQAKNQGKGAALKEGIAAATGEFVVIQDADFEYDMADLPRLLEPLLAGQADVVYGSRFRKDGTQVHRTFHYLINRVLTIFSNLYSGLYLTDMETCYKLFRREVIQNVNLSSQRFGFEPEITAKLSRLRLRFRELPISYYPRNYLQGKKITWRDGLAAFWHIVYFNVLASKKHFFKETLPKKYLPDGRQWL